MIDFEVLTDLKSGGFGAEQSRSWFMSYSSIEDLEKGNNKTCPNIITLNGEWNFNYFNDVRAAQNFPDIESPLTVKVPHSAQLDGFDRPIYCGGGYIMPYFPPYVPKENPAFAYKKIVNLTRGGRKFIAFDGVDSCFYLSVNGQVIGFARVSHSLNEFEITDYIKDGENEICVLVVKFNAGSYLEDQDKWRLSGIFRSVYIISRPQKFLRDYTVTTRIGESACVAEFAFDNPQNVPVKVCFNGCEFEALSNRVSVVAENVKLWSAEQPDLYDFIIVAGEQGEEEYIREKVGFREIKVEDGVVKVNGKAIKLHGVNRHEFHPEKGAAINQDDMLYDLSLMKKLNVNAIRTSHYPNMHEFYEACDEYGFYVVDEADLECHGAAHQNGINTYEEKLFSDLAENAEWESEFMRRIEKLYSRDKNRPCVLFWSLGNESGYGRNFEASAKWLKSRGDGRLIHYEGIFHRPGEDIYYTKNLDVMSRMYPELKWLTDDYLNDERETRPLLICEYSHAMGNSNGDLKDYWDILESNPRFCGAFVWEWADHGINTGDGKLKFGGDFGEKKHTGKFCMDGLLSSYREIRSGAKEMQHIYSPVTVEKTGENLYEIFNGNYFVCLENLCLKWAVKLCGKVVCRGELDINGLAPRTKKTFSLNKEVLAELKKTCDGKKEKLASVEGGKMVRDEDGENGVCGLFANLVIEILTVEDKGLLKGGERLYDTAFELIPYVCESKPVAVCESLIKQTEREIIVTSNSFEYAFDKDSGELVSVKIGGKELLVSPMRVNVARARLDNDMAIYGNWESAGLCIVKPYVTESFVEYGKAGASVRFNCALLCESTRPHVTYTVEYVINGGRLDVKINAEVSDFIKYLPRFGVEFALPKSYDFVEYLGRNGESYPDKKNYAYKDYSSFNVDEDFTNYTVPQECGSRADTNKFTVSGKGNGASRKIKIRSEKTFSFSVLPYSTLELNAAAHNWQLEKSEKNTVCIDYKMSGVGSNSCGPELDERYRLSEKNIDFSFYIEF